MNKTFQLMISWDQWEVEGVVVEVKVVWAAECLVAPEVAWGQAISLLEIKMASILQMLLDLIFPTNWAN